MLSDPVGRLIVRALADEEQTQAELVRTLELGQSLVSRSIKALRGAGMVESDTPRGALRLRADGEVRQVLLAADRLAEALLVLDGIEQSELSERTRRTVIRTASSRGRRAGGDHE